MAESTAIIRGRGSNKGDDNFLQRRGKKKVISQTVAKHIMKFADKEGDSRLKKKARNTYYCQSTIIEHGGKLHGNYCKNRFCTICQSNRKADMINRYFPALSRWKEPFLVTLTVKNCKAQQLRKTMQEMMQAFQLITARHRKANLRGTGVKLIGIRAMECTYNPARKDYHPHFHVIVPSEEIANILLSEWLEHWTPHFAGGRGQHKRPIRNLQKDMKEAIKYGSKIFTDDDPSNKSKGKARKDTLYAKALYNILKAMDGQRIFDRFGFNLSKTEREYIPAQVVTDFATWKYFPHYCNWIANDSGETLTEEGPPTELLNLLAYSVDINSE